MARLLQKTRNAIGAFDRVEIRGVRHVSVLSDDKLHVLRYEKGNVHVCVTHREFAELLAVREASIEPDYFLKHPRVWARSRSFDCFNRLAAAQPIERADTTRKEAAEAVGPELIVCINKSFQQPASARASGPDLPSPIGPTQRKAMK